ncbi:hypothetical protein ACKKBF_B11110 [Auxenochlorella protothecoides x Auxenochlorella symbiontica]
MHRRQACAALPNDENPEQAVQRRLRESEEVAERVKFLQDRVELDAALERAGDSLVVLEVASEEICQTGWDEEPELQWDEDKRAALEPCLRLKHTFARIARDCSDAVFLAISADDPKSKELVEELQVKTIPTVQFIKNKQLLWEHKGINKLEQNLSEGVLYYGDQAAENLKASSFVKDLHSPEEFQEFVKSQDKDVLTVVDVCASMCEPCVHIFPAVLALARNFEKHAAFARVQLDETPELEALLAGSLGIRDVPTFLFYRNGAAVGRHVGGSRADLIGNILQQQVGAGHPLPPPGPKATKAAPAAARKFSNW